MHTLQIMLVEADSAEDAIGEAEARSGYSSDESGNSPDWSDWHVVGGRWEGHFEGSNALKYADNLTLAEDTIKEALLRRKAEMERLREEANFEALATAVDNYDPDNPVLSMEVWSAKKLAEMVLGFWTPDSAVFDLHDYTAGLKYFRDRLEKDYEKQYLVAVDFHF